MTANGIDDIVCEDTNPFKFRVSPQLTLTVVGEEPVKSGGGNTFTTLVTGLVLWQPSG